MYVKKNYYFCVESDGNLYSDIEALIYLPSYQTSTICISEGQGVTTLVYWSYCTRTMYDAIS